MSKDDCMDRRVFMRMLGTHFVENNREEAEKKWLEYVEDTCPDVNTKLPPSDQSAHKAKGPVYVLRVDGRPSVKWTKGKAPKDKYMYDAYMRDQVRIGSKRFWLMVNTYEYLVNPKTGKLLKFGSKKHTAFVSAMKKKHPKYYIDFSKFYKSRKDMFIRDNDYEPYNDGGCKLHSKDAFVRDNGCSACAKSYGQRDNDPPSSSAMNATAMMPMKHCALRRTGEIGAPALGGALLGGLAFGGTGALIGGLAGAGIGYGLSKDEYEKCKQYNERALEHNSRLMQQMGR